MLPRTTGLIPILSLTFCLGACTEPPKPKKSPPKPGADATKVENEATGVAKVTPAPADEEGVSTPAGEDPLGSRFRDPAWYAPEIIPHTKVLQNGRSEARDDGTFSSAMVFELEAEMTPEDCVTHLQGKVGDVSFTGTETGEDGRLTARGETERYRVTLVCGNAKGKPTAYVGYEWKSDT